MPSEISLPQGTPLPEGWERVDPRILQFVMQAAQVGQLVRMRRLEESKRVKGSDSDTLSLTTGVTRYKCFEPWASVTIINDGPDSIYHEINDPKDIYNTGTSIRAAKLQSGESFTFNAEYPTIRSLYLRAVSSTASVRLKAKVGQA